MQNSTTYRLEEYWEQLTDNFSASIAYVLQEPAYLDMLNNAFRLGESCGPITDPAALNPRMGFGCWDVVGIVVKCAGFCVES